MCDDGFSAEQIVSQIESCLLRRKTKETYGSLLDADVLDVQVIQFKVFSVRIRFCVLEETQNELNRLLGPATFEVQS